MAFIQSSFNLLRPRSAETFRASESQHPTCVPSRITMTASVPRRTLLRLAALTLGATLLSDFPKEANAFSLKDKSAVDMISTIALGKRKAEDLKAIVGEYKAECTEEQRLNVFRFIPIWIEPALVASKGLIEYVDPSIVDTAKLKEQADFMFGHLLELKDETRNRRSAGIIRELDEIVETADEIFKIAQPYVPKL